jgi:alpha-methylacyl-CoA racemase
LYAVVAGPLAGIRVLELAGIGPGPFAGMMLADMGADVVRVDRVKAPTLGVSGLGEVLDRGRRSLRVDVKRPEGLDLVLRLVESSDVLIEGYRPGVTERMGLGPDECLARNPRLVYGRMTGWGQDGPYAHTAGHDLNYIALAGVLDHIGRSGGAPTPPLNLVGDFGGGGMLLAFGVVAALVERATSGKGQVIDAAMVDGAALLMAFFRGGELGPRGTNVLDSGAPFYDVYECADGRYVSIGSIEPPFYAELRQRLGLDDPIWDRQLDESAWPEQKAQLAAVIRTKTRDEWSALLEGSDVCFAPVLSMDEAPAHPHLVARRTFAQAGGVVQPTPAPRFSRTPGELPSPSAGAGSHTDDVLADLGLDEATITKLRETGVVA